MNREVGTRLARLLLGLAALAAFIAAAFWLAGRDEPQIRARLVAMAGDAAGYRRAEAPLPLVFPADHGAHPDYQTEWWYYTGNLRADGGEPLGYQLTFFRRALVPPAERVDRPSAWATDHAYMAHLAVTDVSAGRFQAFERFSRSGAGLAGARATPYAVWLEDWSAEEVEAGTVRLRAAQDDVALDLLLVDTRGPVLHGENGFSPKGSELGNASYYYSLTHLETTGSVRMGARVYRASGLSWMDHEWSTSSLGSDQVGWDWFSIQLDDGSALMAFQLRREDGSIDPYSSGTYVSPDGAAQHLTTGDLEIRAEGTWRSPDTGAIYPARWTIRVPALELEIEIVPRLAAQELVLAYSYWEGAVGVEGRRAGRPVAGSGYVELTGYAGSMRGQF
jgi:predicted secreted hydrolase